MYYKNDIETNKILSFMSYLGILFIVPLLAAPKSQFAKFHVNQGIVLFIAEAIISIPLAIIVGVFSIIPIVGLIIILPLSLAYSAAAIGFKVFGIVNCVNGKAKELPFIGKHRIFN